MCSTVHNRGVVLRDDGQRESARREHPGGARGPGGHAGAGLAARGGHTVRHLPTACLRQEARLLGQ
jgi:hypothetical protein